MKRNPGALALALYSNTPEARNELLFRKGDILTVIEYDYEGQTGWWLCSHRGQRGICPSNYLQLLEDNYSFIDRRPELKRSLSQAAIVGDSHESALKGYTVDGEGKAEGKAEEIFDPLETYDVPRSVCMQSLSKSSDPLDESVLYSNQQPLYQNEEDFLTKTSPLDLYDVPRSQLPIYGQSLARLRRYGHEASESSLAQRPKGGISGSLQNFNNWNNFSTSSKHSSSSFDLGLPPSGTGNSRGSNRSSPDNSSNSSRGSNLSAKSISTIPKSTTSRSRTISQTLSRGSSQEVQLRRPPPLINSSIPINHSNRSSIQSESAESGIGMVSSPPNQDDLYDVPRSTAVPVQHQIGVGAGGVNGGGQNNGTSCSRPQSSLSVSSSGMGLSIANSDSKDSLDLYDVPRSAKSYVNHMETKYDHVHSRHGSVSSESSNASLTRDSTLTKSNGATGVGAGVGHSRHNSTSSIFSAYGYSRETANFPDGRRPSAGMNSDFGSRSSLASGVSFSNHHQPPIPYNPANDLYDVPRNNCAPPPNPRTHKLGGGILGSSSASVASSRSQTSLEGSTTMLYDVPPSFAKKVSLSDSSSETLSCKDSSDGGGSGRNGSLSRSELRLGASSSSLMPTSPRNNHFGRRGSNGMGAKSGLMANSGAGTGVCSTDVKILPLGPKAAVSVCEKLRHEVVTSIASILNQVKPKWRSKENLTSIMPDLRFSCTRLSLAIKDVAEFATRALSNAKQIGDEALVTKLHRLIIPVMNGSGIIQRDVDELDAYFWSPDRLSVTSGSHHEKNASGDALDQLILCARSLKHDVTEIANFLALNSSTLFRDQQEKHSTAVDSAKRTSQMVESKVEEDDDDYVNLVPGTETETAPSSSLIKSKAENALSSRPVSIPVQLDSRDEQLLEFYSAQIGLTAPLLSQSISTFISAIHQNEPPESFNVHLKYVILFAYRMLFGGDTVHRNVNNLQLKMEIESRANLLHKSILALYESSKVATLEFPKIGPMQGIVEKVWETTQAATQLKKVIFNATCATL